MKGVLKARIQQLLTFDEIPLHFKSHDRFMDASKKLWLLEETILPIIEISSIVDRCIIWLEDNPLPSYYNFSIAEIIYKFNNRWKIRSINFRHQHPIERLQLQDSPSDIPVLKFFWTCTMMTSEHSEIHIIHLVEYICK